MTPPPRSRKQTQRYPDATQWGAAHDLELSKLDDAGAIQWLSPTQIPAKAKMIPLTMTYRCKRDPNRAVNEHKARCSVRGDLMKPHVHFNPAHKASHMADKSSVRLLLALNAAGNLKCEHLYITSAYIHEKYQHSKPVYVKQHPRFNGKLKHMGSGGLLVKNLYGTPSGGYYYVKGAQQYLRHRHYQQSEQDCCLSFQLHSATSFIFIAMSSDDFLVVASHT